MDPLKMLPLTVVSLLITAAAILVAVQNWQTGITLTLGSIVWENAPLGLALLFFFILGEAGAFIQIGNIIQQMRSEIKRAELRKEKAEVKAETTSDQTQALESKIRTLEKALEQALSSQQQSRKQK